MADTTTTAPTTTAPTVAATAKGLLAAYAAARALKGAQRAREVARVRLNAGALAHAAAAAPREVRMSVTVDTTTRGEVVRESITVPVVAVLTAMALGGPVQGSSRLAL